MVCKKITLENFIDRAVKIYGNNYDYSKVVYHGMLSKVEIICLIHGAFWKTPAHHLNNQGCPLCSRKLSHEKQKLSIVDFINRANLIHKNKYSYENSIYIDYFTKLEINCHLHGNFYQIPANHLRGQGCPSCGKISISNKNSLTKDDFITRAQLIHENKYDYSKVIYSKSNKKVEIVCLKHQEIFFQTPANHLTGNGCHKCGFESMANARRHTLEIFINKSNIIHNNYYNYDQVIYINNSTKVKITCPKHGIFLQIPANHLSKHGCPKCCPYGYSKKEIKWLNYLNIAQEYRQFFIKIKNCEFYVDGFDPITNTVYEFNGDYYHGNPAIFNPNDYNTKCKKTFGELYQKTLAKEKLLKEAGYNLVSIWENEFDKIYK